MTAIKGPPNPILSLTIAGPTELSENGRYLITPLQAKSPLFSQDEGNIDDAGLANLISLATSPDEQKNAISILPDSIETGHSPEVLSFLLSIPTELMGEEILLTFDTAGYQAQMPLLLQSMPLAQINYPRSLSDITFNPDEETIVVQVDGRLLPVGTPGHWEFTLWDLTSGELLRDVHSCQAMKGVCVIPYDFSHPCLTLDIKLIGQIKSGTVQASEQLTDCP